MTKLSTGEDSTLGTYKKWARIFGPDAVKFIEDKIKDSPNGENEDDVFAGGHCVRGKGKRMSNRGDAARMSLSVQFGFFGTWSILVLAFEAPSSFMSTKHRSPKSSSNLLNMRTSFLYDDNGVFMHSEALASLGQSRARNATIRGAYDPASFFFAYNHASFFGWPPGAGDSEARPRGGVDGGRP